MLADLRAGIPSATVAAQLGRTPRAILCRQQRIAAQMAAVGVPVAAAAAAACLSPDMMAAHDGPLAAAAAAASLADTGAAGAKTGKKWTVEDEAVLLAASRDGRFSAQPSATAAVLELGRSLAALLGRLHTIAARLVAEGADEGAAAAATGLSPAAVREALLRHRSTSTAPPVPEAVLPQQRAPEPTLEQRAALDAVRAGRDVLLTGPAGTGKSFAVGLLVAQARAAGKAVAVAATTGAASVLVGGTTLHAFLGIGTGARPLSELLWHVRYRAKRALARVRAFDLLVVDEVSMLSADLFDKVVALLDALRGGAPYQLVLTGDFAQLPPVQGRFAFQSEAWARRAPTVVRLTRLLRQADDAPFQAMLERLRWGRPSPADLDALRALRNTVFPEGVEPTRLHSRNAEVDAINAAAFEALVAGGAPTRDYARVARGERAKAWADSASIPDRVQLAVGAQVMVTRNMPALGLVNGSRGVVTALRPEAVVVRTVAGREVALRPIPIACESEPELACSAMPLRLAYAMSIHKSQGVTLDAMEVDLGRSVFEFGQGYVAISRARNLASVRVLDVDERAFRAHPDVVSFYNG